MAGGLVRVFAPGPPAAGSPQHSSRRWSRGGRADRRQPASWLGPRTSQTATDLDRLVTEVTIIDPSHPLHGQRLAVESLASSRGPAWVTVVLADGRRRQVRRSATDLAGPSAPPVRDGEQRRV